MKKLLFITALLLVAVSVSAQKSVDRLFEKYSGKEGYSTLTISGNLLNLTACFDVDENEADKDINARITGIRILSQKDKDFQGENFLDFISSDLGPGYEEFMSVKESGQDMKMLVRQEGKRISELLIVTGGRDNALIQVKGAMTVSDAKRISRQAHHNHGVKITTD